jgi:hypothetical protein
MLAVFSRLKETRLVVKELKTNHRCWRELLFPMIVFPDLQFARAHRFQADL